MSTALQIHSPEQAAVAVAAPRRPVALLRPIAGPKELLEAQEAARTLVQEVLKQGRDYGKVPGVAKPFLFKAGAERVALGFGCYYGPPRIVEREIDHDRVMQWRKKVQGQEKTGESLGFYRYVIAVPVYSRETGECIAEGMGSCSTTEAKYCDRPRELENTVLKMAQKRAMVAACLIAFGLSDQFTQDEDVVKETLDEAEDEEGGTAAADEPEAKCPKCSGRMWDNREGKKNRKAPDFKCRDKKCDGVYWPGQWPPKAEEPAVGNGASGSASTDGSPATSDGQETATTSTVPSSGTSTTDKPAREKHLPQMSGYDEYAGKPLGEIPVDVLAAIAEKIAKRKVVPELLLAAVRAVIAEGQAQGSLVEEPAKPAAAVPVNTPPGRVQDALELTPREQAALATPSDDLPF